MKRIALYAIALAVSFLAASCSRKDDPMGLPTLHRLTGFYSEITVEDDMVVLPDEAYSKDLIDNIVYLEIQLGDYISDMYNADQVPADAREQAVRSKNGPFGGVSPFTGEEIAEIPSSMKAIFEEDAIKYLFEEAVGHSSLRRQLAMIEEILVADETFDGLTNNPDNYFIMDDYQRLILNENLEIRVGSKYYKHLSANAMLDMTFDATILADVRGAFPAPQDFNTLPILPNYSTASASAVVQQNQGIIIHDLGMPFEALFCDASFTFSVSGIVNNIFSFTNTSSGSFSSVQWNFGDGTTSTLSNPVHTYPGSGTYTVTLTVKDGTTTCDAHSQVITIGSTCNALFTAVVSTSGSGVVSFTDASTPNSGGVYPVSWAWTFGDGGTSSMSSPVHTYTTQGGYDVCVTIVWSNGCSDSYCTNIGVSLATCCKTNKTNERTDVFVTNSRRALGHINITSIPYYRRVTSETTCYRRKTNGTWVKEEATTIGTGAAGTVYYNDCSEAFGFGFGLYTENNKKSISRSLGFGGGIKTQQNQIAANVYCVESGVTWQTTVSLLTSAQCQ